MPIIRREDIQEVRARTRIEQLVGEYVTLRPAGIGALKGLCPFHDEKTPSFHVRPQLGLWHCFGCNQGGDAIEFIQRINHMDFPEAIEFLADKCGVQLHYENGSGPRRQSGDPVRRQTLLEMNKLAEQFYREQFAGSAGEAARAFIAERNFTMKQAAHFGIGFSLPEWDGLARFLRGRGFTEEQLNASGLFVTGKRGLYDRFRDRVMWPIRDITGATVGFGARKLAEDDDSPKYLNTPETAVYHKSSVLYGLDLAKKTVSTKRQIVIVEGYTDVMAAHCAGITTAVATCGTAFGEGHVQIIRRLLADRFDDAAKLSLENGNQYSGEVIYTFDGDEAGMKAARRAYVEDQAFAARTFVAIDPQGMDPCDIRINRGDAALRELIESRVPLFEFVLRSVMATENLRTIEGRLSALEKVSPVLAGISDPHLRGGYMNFVAGKLSIKPDEIRQMVDRATRQLAGNRQESFRVKGKVAGAGRGATTETRDQSGEAEPAPPAESVLATLPNDPVIRLQTQVLELVLQQPFTCAGSGFDQLTRTSFTERTLQAVYDAIVVAGGISQFLDVLEEAETYFAQNDPTASSERITGAATQKWNQQIREAAVLPQISAVIVELSTADLHLSADADPQIMEHFAKETVGRLQLLDLNRQYADVRAQINLAATDAAVDELSLKANQIREKISSLRKELASLA